VVALLEIPEASVVSTLMDEYLRVIGFPYLAGVVNTDWILVGQLQSFFIKTLLI
jgi:hypothetical protein